MTRKQLPTPPLPPAQASVWSIVDHANSVDSGNQLCDIVLSHEASVHSPNACQKSREKRMH